LVTKLYHRSMVVERVSAAGRFYDISGDPSQDLSNLYSVFYYARRLYSRQLPAKNFSGPYHNRNGFSLSVSTDGIGELAVGDGFEIVDRERLLHGNTRLVVPIDESNGVAAIVGRLPNDPRQRVFDIFVHTEGPSPEVHYRTRRRTNKWHPR